MDFLCVVFIVGDRVVFEKIFWWVLIGKIKRRTSFFLESAYLSEKNLIFTDQKM
jgi:hypothetical protein